MRGVEEGEVGRGLDISYCTKMKFGRRTVREKIVMSLIARPQLRRYRPGPGSPYCLEIRSMIFWSSSLQTARSGAGVAASTTDRIDGSFSINEVRICKCVEGGRVAEVLAFGSNADIMRSSPSMSPRSRSSLTTGACSCLCFFALESDSRLYPRLGEPAMDEVGELGGEGDVECLPLFNNRGVMFADIGGG
jgi:hypothetical protein